MLSYYGARRHFCYKIMFLNWFCCNFFFRVECLIYDLHEYSYIVNMQLELGGDGFYSLMETLIIRLTLIDFTRKSEVKTYFFFFDLLSIKRLPL